MTVQDLIKQLQKYPPQMLVVMSRDEEGNGYHSVSDDLSLGRYVDGEYSTYPEEYEEYGFNRPGSEEAVCIWPGW